MLRLTAAVVVIAAVTSPAALAYSDPPQVVFAQVGDTYDAATLKAVGDETSKESVDLGDEIYGGVVLAASATQRVQKDALVGPGVGDLPITYSDPGYPCDYDTDPTCRLEILPFINCGASTVGSPPKGRPTGNGRWKAVKWTATGCTGGGYIADNIGTTFPLASGTTTYTVSNYKRVKKPAVYRTYVEGSDGYFNVCLSIDHISDVVQRNGVRQCTVLISARVDKVTFTLRQRTRLDPIPPAFACTTKGWAYDGKGCS